MKNNNLITISWTIQVIGDKGTEKYFLMRHQYEVGELVNALVSCDSCGVPEVYRKHYQYTDTNGEIFLIPEDNCAFEGRVREEWETDLYKQREKQANHPKNYNQVYKEVYGIDRIAASRRQDNGYQIAKELGYIK